MFFSVLRRSYYRLRQANFSSQSRYPLKKIGSSVFLSRCQPWPLTVFLLTVHVVKLALPHIALFCVSVLYCVVGALVFSRLEGTQAAAAFQKIERRIGQAKSELIWQLYNSTWTENSRVDETFWKMRGDALMKNFTALLHGIHGGQMAFDLSIRDKWSFSRSFFFVATTLTSIGYGNQTPATRIGRLFCTFYALLGLPLVVISIADIAKFLSDFIMWCYMKYLLFNWRVRTLFRRWRRRLQRRRESLRKGKLRADSTVSNFDDDDDSLPKGQTDEEVAEFLWVHLVNAEFVEVPAALMFALILCYVALGGCLFGPLEGWTFFEGFYFSLISILAIGFGDYTPKNERFLFVSLVYVVLGLILTTTCIDIVGVDYVNKMHFWGRRLHKADPMQWLKAVQERRLRNMKRRAMAALFETLTVLQHMRVDPTLISNNRRALTLAEQSAELEKQAAALLNAVRTSNHSPPPHVQIGRNGNRNSLALQSSEHLVPSAARNFCASNITAHTMTLTWCPPSVNATHDMYYTLSYQLSDFCERGAQYLTKMAPLLPFMPPAALARQNQLANWERNRSAFTSFRNRLAPRRSGTNTIDNLPSTTTTYVVNDLKSFALYQFTLVAVNKHGRSRPVRLQEYTEPSTVPLNIRADTVSDKMARISWDSPARNKYGTRRYSVHVTSDASRPFVEWQRIEVTNGTSADLTQLQPLTAYMVCVSANHNSGLATFSRSLQLLTMPKSATASPEDNANSNTIATARENLSMSAPKMQFCIAAEDF